MNRNIILLMNIENKEEIPTMYSLLACKTYLCNPKNSSMVKIEPVVSCRAVVESCCYKTRDRVRLNPNNLSRLLVSHTRGFSLSI
jgi:hypothetical protein